MNRKRLNRLEETAMHGLMIVAFLTIAGALVALLVAVAWKGVPGLNWAMITQTPKGGFYLGKEGGILNAILGSLYLATGGTLLALVVAMPIVLSLDARKARGSWAQVVRLSLDVAWGVPSIVYGAFGLSVMLWLGWRASLGAGIVVLALLELPILTRAIDVVIRMAPPELREAGLSLGTTRSEMAQLLLRQTVPGIVTAVMLAFGRGIGDAASVLFTAGYTDNLPTSLARPVASLPLAVFFQLGTPFPEVQRRAYASALVLTILILIISLGSRWLSVRLSRNVVK